MRKFSSNFKGTLHAILILCTSTLSCGYLTGCASMFSEATDPMTFDSSPPGASVTINGKYVGKTPLQTRLEKKSDNVTATFRLDGYIPQTLSLSRSISGAAWFNLGFITTTSGAPSWGLDALNGKLMSYDPRSYVVQLEAINAKHTDASAPSNTLEFVLTNYQPLRLELAQKKGEYFTSLCALYELNGSACDALYSRLRARSDELIHQPNSLAWYRAVYKSIE